MDSKLRVRESLEISPQKHPPSIYRPYEVGGVGACRGSHGLSDELIQCKPAERNNDSRKARIWYSSVIESEAQKSL
jgi:hypothetical protein